MFLLFSRAHSDLLLINRYRLYIANVYVYRNYSFASGVLYYSRAIQSRVMIICAKFSNKLSMICASTLFFSINVKACITSKKNFIIFPKKKKTFTGDRKMTVFFNLFDLLCRRAYAYNRDGKEMHIFFLLNRALCRYIMFVNFLIIKYADRHKFCQINRYA